MVDQAMEKSGVLSVQAILPAGQVIPAWAQVEVDQVCAEIANELSLWQEYIADGKIPPEYNLISAVPQFDMDSPENLRANFKHYAGVELKNADENNAEVFAGPYHLEVSFERGRFTLRVLSEDKVKSFELAGRVPKNLVREYWDSVVAIRGQRGAYAKEIADQFRKAKHGELTDRLDGIFGNKIQTGAVTIKNLALLAIMLHPDKENPYMQRDML